MPITSQEQRMQLLTDYRSALEDLVDDNSEAAIVQIQNNEINVMKCADKNAAAEWLRARGHEDFAALVETPTHPVFFAAVVVNEGGITVSHMRRKG